MSAATSSVSPAAPTAPPSIMIRPGVAPPPPRPARKSPDHAAPGSLSRAQILRATGDCFAEVGYEGTTIRAIAARLGCSVGSIYRYFEDKRRLLIACGVRLLEPVIEPLERGEATLGESVRAYLREAGEHVELYRLLFWLAAREAGGEEPGATGIGPDHSALPEPVGRILREWARLTGDRGEAERCWATLHGMLMLGSPPEEIHRAALASIERTAHAADTEAAGRPKVWTAQEDVTLL